MFVQTVAVSLFALLLGLVLCFAGWRFFVTLLPLWAFFAGFLVTAQAIQELFGGGFLATTSGWVFGFLAGVVCALVAYVSYYAAVIILAASAEYELGIGILSGLGVSAGFLLFVAGVVMAAAVVAAAVLLHLPRLLVVALTAGVGASLILTGILVALGRISLTALSWDLVGDFIRASWFWSLVFLVLAGGGHCRPTVLPRSVHASALTSGAAGFHVGPRGVGAQRSRREMRTTFRAPLWPPPRTATRRDRHHFTCDSGICAGIQSGR